MESKYNFNSQICTTREQSERLLALGLKKETADMCWLDHALTEDYEDWRAILIYNDWEEWQRYGIPAWSLGRLIKLMPRTAILHPEEGNVRIGIDMYAIEILVNDDSIAEAVSVIEWLIKEGNFNKKYLEE